MNSIKPYIIRSVYEFGINNNYVIALSLFTGNITNKIITANAINNRITIYISPEYVQNLFIFNNYITFKTTISNKLIKCKFFMPDILTIFMNETGEGFSFLSDQIVYKPILKSITINNKFKPKPKLKVI